MSETITITILFTDIVGSTTLRQRHGERAAHEIMAAHNEIVRGRIKDHAGLEIKTIGDSFMASFESARKAVEWVLSRLAPLCGGANDASYVDHATCMIRIAMRA
jgi:class 3 adenylate cyclase